MDLQAERVTLNKLFGTIGEQFQIPPYQRPYAWEAEQIDDLWDDLTSTLAEGHFLGTIVLHDAADDRPQIIDGQQRIITLMLLLGLIRDEYNRLGSALEGRVQQVLLADAFTSGDDRFKVKTGQANWRAFRDAVLRAPDDTDRISFEELQALPKDLRARNRLLFDNAARLQDRLEAWLDGTNGSKRRECLERLEQAIVSRLQLVVIRVRSVADAFLLFETLNDRGLQLSAADLLKNHLLARIASGDPYEGNVAEAASEWDGLIDDLGPDVDVTRFLRHYLLIKFPKVRKDDVFDRFKTEIARTGPWQVLSELRAFGRLYGDFEQPRRVEEEAVSSVLRDLKTLRATTCYAALMPARRYLSSDDFVAFARLAEVLTFRYSTIVGLDSKELERAYHRAAKRLFESQGSDLEAARAELVRMVPPSEIFVQSFMKQRMGRHYLVRYTLGRIEEVVSTEREKTIKPNRKVHIEHIMPRTLNDAWRKELGDRLEEHTDYVEKWGNLTLLYYKLNAAASNSAFVKKKREYRTSEIELTRRLCRYEGWTFDDITERQRWLADVADQVWRVDALAGEQQSLPPSPDERPHPRDFLGGNELARLEELAIETSAGDANLLAGRISTYLDQIKVEATSNSAVDLDLANQIADVLTTLSNESSTLDGWQRTWLRGAVEYFVLPGDEQDDFDSPIGFVDDARVTNAICEVLGRSELKIPLKDKAPAES